MGTTSHKLSQRDYRDFCDFVNHRVGLHIGSSKRENLEKCLLDRMSRLGHSSPREYLGYVSRIPSSHDEMKELVKRLTIGETYFFRDHNQLNVVRENILKPLINKRNLGKRRLKIWSAGCASGEEPYSLAIIIRELIPYLNYWQLKIIATDINHQFLKKAKSAVYNNWSFRNTPASVRRKYFVVDGDQYRLRDEIRRMVTFNYLNLVDPCYPSFFNNTNDIDLIICRNVAIYFNKKTTKNVIERFYDCLNEDGWLIMGASDPYISDSRFHIREVDQLFLYHKSPRKLSTPRRVKPAAEADKPKKINRQTAKIVKQLPLRTDYKRPAKINLATAKKKDDHYTVGMYYFNSNNYQRALVEFQEGLQKKDMAARCAYMIAKIKADSGELATAKKWCRKALTLDKLFLEAYFLLYMIYQGLGRDKPALEALKKTIYIKPDFAEGHFCLGVIYKKTGDSRAAEKAFRNVEKLLSSKSAGKEIPECPGMTYGKLLKCARDNLTK